VQVPPLHVLLLIATCHLRCRRDVSLRLGSGVEGAEAIKIHPYDQLSPCCHPPTVSFARCRCLAFYLLSSVSLPTAVSSVLSTGASCLRGRFPHPFVLTTSTISDISPPPARAKRRCPARNPLILPSSFALVAAQLLSCSAAQLLSCSAAQLLSCSAAQLLSCSAA
jgi:hypothetical protein